MPVKPHTILFRWLKKLRIPVSPTYIRQLLNSHPDYPSLLSITDTLDELGIDNTAIQIEKEQLHEMPVPFIAHLNGNSGEFVIVENRDNLDKQYPDFFKRWDGVAIAAEKQEGWQNKLNIEWLQKDKIKRQFVLFTLGVLFFFGIFSAAVSFSWMQLSLLLIAIAGLFVSWMTVSKDLGIENKIADELCGATADCNTVIHSKTAKLPFGIGWSDAGIIYFSFLLFIIVIASFTKTTYSIYPFLALLATCALPITFLSVYYQWWVIKKWCRLCLVTVGLLWGQFGVMLLLINSGNLQKVDLTKISFSNLALVLFILSLITIIWLWLKPLLEENRKWQTENLAGKRFKNNPDIFLALLEKQRKVDITPFEDELQIGNPAATLQIIVACNPYCGPCAKAHEVLHELMERNDIGLTIRFTIKTGNLEDKKLLAVEYMLGLCKGKDELYKRKLLHDWYQWMDMEKFKLNYSFERGENTITQLEFFEKWSKETKIVFTPTIFINGFEMPKHYKADDLSGLIRTVKERLPVKQNELMEK